MSKEVFRQDIRWFDVFFYKVVTAVATSSHSANFSGLKLIDEELLGNIKPITSKIIAMVLAVYKPEQDPQLLSQAFSTMFCFVDH